MIGLENQLTYFLNTKEIDVYHPDTLEKERAKILDIQTAISPVYFIETTAQRLSATENTEIMTHMGIKSLFDLNPIVDYYPYQKIGKIRTINGLAPFIVKKSPIFYHLVYKIITDKPTYFIEINGFLLRS